MTQPTDRKTSGLSCDNQENTYCICCLNTASAPYLPGLRRCTSCGHVVAILSWSPEMFRDLYSEHYFKGGEYSDYESEKAALRHNFQRRVRELAQRFPEGGTLWEIGCAYGFFLKEASTHFNAAGCDVAREAVQSAQANQQVNAQCMDYLAYQPEQPFNVVCMWDTIEHLPQPHLFLEKAYRDLQPGGLLALSTGDIGSWCARLRGRRWRQIHPPTHVHYFTRGSMQSLLSRLGFTNIVFSYPAFWRNLDTTLQKITPENRIGNMIYWASKHAGLSRFNFPLNLFDLMTVHATKPQHHDSER